MGDLEESDDRRLLAAGETTPGCPVIAVAAGPAGGAAGDVARAPLGHSLVSGLGVTGAQCRHPTGRRHY